MPRPTSPRDRDRAKQQARVEAHQRRSQAARRQRMVLGIVGLVLVLALVAGLAGAFVGNNDKSSTSSGASSTTSSTGTTVPASGNAALPQPPKGEQLTGPTPCPAEDGSSARTTSFAGPPPTCIDPSRFYDAVLKTSVGDIKLQLNPQQAPNAVNNFVVLARYHYYDGQPFDRIFPREAAAVNALFEGQSTAQSPGYSIPGETTGQGGIYVPGTIAMIPDPDAPDSGFGGKFLLATFEQAAGLPTQLTSFGIMLDGQDALIAIDRAGSQQGTPVTAIVINSIEITPSVPLS